MVIANFGVVADQHGQVVDAVGTGYAAGGGGAVRGVAMASKRLGSRGTAVLRRLVSLPF